MEHKDFFTLMKTAIKVNGEPFYLLTEEDPLNPELLATRVVSVAYHANSSDEVISIFERLMEDSNSELDFLNHLQILLTATELTSERKLTQAFFKATLDSDEEKTQRYHKQAECEFRLRKLGNWISSRIRQLQSPILAATKVFKWKAQPSVLIELLLTLQFHKWIEFVSTDGTKRVADIENCIEIIQPYTRGTLESYFTPSDSRVSDVKYVYEALFRLYNGPHFLPMKVYDGSLARPGKKNSGRKKRKS